MMGSDEGRGASSKSGVSGTSVALSAVVSQAAEPPSLSTNITVHPEREIMIQVGELPLPELPRP